MATCPVCQSALEISAQHHGTLYTCPRCSAVFFVDWSGQPEVAIHEEPAHNEPPYEPPQNQFAEAAGFQPANQDSNFGQAPQESYSASESVGDSFSEPLPEAPAEYETSEEQAFDANPEVGFEPAYDPVPEVDAFGAEPLQPMSAAEVFADVTSFGNAETSQSAFAYSVRISGIDTGEVRKNLMDALSDSKFGWDSAELISQIKDGSLTIRSVSAVKASILVQRIKYLPVTVSWRQDVLSGSV